MKRKQLGVTLLELMLVVGLVALIAAIAVPSYRGYITRAQRTDATAALLRIAAAQEKFYLQNNTYTNNLTSLGVANTEHGWYSLNMNSTASATGFTATATALTGSRQFRDSDCRSFTIAETGQRGAKKSDGTTDNTETCWR